MDLVLIAAEASTANLISVASAAVSALMAIGALILGFYNFVTANRRERERDEFQRRMTEEAVETQRQLLVIEEQRLGWERQAREAEEGRRRQAEEKVRGATFAIRSSYRDSARTWARVIATNQGPAQARDVFLDVWYDYDGQRREIDTLAGHDQRRAESLAPNESVHVAVVFSLASPPAHNLRYQVRWTDDRGSQVDAGQVPLL